MKVDRLQNLEIELSHIPLPNNIEYLIIASYTYSGKIAFIYKDENDPKDKDWFSIGIIDDNGDNFKKIFSGYIKIPQKSNGLRMLPFQDNTRLLLGDYILECSPDIDNCKTSNLVKLQYPIFLDFHPLLWLRWSEVIVSPDNVHVCWTSLRKDFALNFIGKLRRKKDKYKIVDPQIISSFPKFKKVKGDFYIVNNDFRGGEVKQFVKGGRAITLVGNSGRGVANSILQDLITGEVQAITNSPGYDETTIFSPDEKLGIVMSTRFSPKTNMAILGLLPRPYGWLVLNNLIMYVYLYAIQGVRFFRKGNIGPVLIDLERSMNEENYKGISLADKEEKWVYCSPISWHPSSKKAIWMEMLRGDRSKMRIKKLEIKGYSPDKELPVEGTPDKIPYSIKGIKAILKYFIPIKEKDKIKISGKSSGYIEYKKEFVTPKGISKELNYLNFSDDGRNIYNGYEKLFQTQNQLIYESNVVIEGEEKGEMKLRIKFNLEFINGNTIVKLDKKESYGYTKYKDIVINVEDMEE